jgi:hypothetical protein
VRAAAGRAGRTPWGRGTAAGRGSYCLFVQCGTRCGLVTHPVPVVCTARASRRWRGDVRLTGRPEQDVRQERLRKGHPRLPLPLPLAARWSEWVHLALAATNCRLHAASGELVEGRRPGLVPLRRRVACGGDLSRNASNKPYILEKCHLRTHANSAGMMFKSFSIYARSVWIGLDRKHADARCSRLVDLHLSNSINRLFVVPCLAS